MNQGSIDGGSFVIDAETLDAIFTDPKQNFLRSKLIDALSEGRALITFLSLQQLKENCPSAHKHLTSMGVAVIGRSEVIKLARAMLDYATTKGVNVTSLALKAKIYVLAVAKAKGCNVVTADCRSTSLSTLELAKLYGVAVECL